MIGQDELSELKKRAETDEWAMVELGFLYQDMEEENAVAAFASFVKAAREGNLVAIFQVGKCFEYGKGCDQCERTALKWYYEAWQRGFEQAKIRYERLYQCLIDDYEEMQQHRESGSEEPFVSGSKKTPAKVIMLVKNNEKEIEGNDD